MRKRTRRPDLYAGEERRRWIEHLIDEASDGKGIAPSPQTNALFAELVHVFNAGAWIATMILAHAVLEADLVETGIVDPASLNERRHGRGFTWLRHRRNSLVHADGPSPAVTIDSLVNDAAILERDARRAVKLVVNGLSGRF